MFPCWARVVNRQPLVECVAVPMDHEVLHQGIRSSVGKEDKEGCEDKDAQSALSERLETQLGQLKANVHEEELEAKLAEQSADDGESSSTESSSFGGVLQPGAKKRKARRQGQGKSSSAARGQSKRTSSIEMSPDDARSNTREARSMNSQAAGQGPPAAGQGRPAAGQGRPAVGQGQAACSFVNDKPPAAGQDMPMDLDHGDLAQAEKFLKHEGHFFHQ